MVSYKVGQILKVNRRLVSQYNAELGTYSTICMVLESTKDEKNDHLYKLYQIDNAKVSWSRLDHPDNIEVASVEIINDVG